MATASCTVNKFRSYNNGWTGWHTPSTKVLGAYCFGKFTSGSSNIYRRLVISITTPSYPATADSSRSLTINIPLWRTSSGTDKWYCAITTTDGTTVPTTWVSSQSITSSSTYAVKTFTTGKFAFKSNTTYYLWLYSDTPTGNSTVGCYSNNYGVGNISVSTTYTTSTSTTDFIKPTNVRLYGHVGSYSGCQIIIDRNDSYPYIYVGNSTTGKYYLRTSVTETDEGSIFKIDPSTSARTLYITRCKTKKDNAAFNLSSTYYLYYQPPLYACQIYCNSDTPLIFDSKSESGNSYVVDGLTAKGLTTSPTSTTPEISITSGLAWSTNGTKLEGKTWYMLYDSTKSYTLYCGGPTAHTLSGNRRHYGMGDIEVSSCKLDGTTTISDIMDLPACESNSAFDLLYCLVEEENANYSDANSNSVASYIDHKAAFHSSSDTLYTIYKKTPPESVNITHYYLTDSVETMTQSVEYELSCHGKGAYYNDFYNKSHIVHGAAICPINWAPLGWKKDGDNNVYQWEELIDTSLPYAITDIYQIITPDNNTYFGNSSWKKIKTYYGVNGKWVPALIRQGVNGEWLGYSTITLNLKYEHPETGEATSDETRSYAYISIDNINYSDNLSNIKLKAGTVVKAIVSNANAFATRKAEIILNGATVVGTIGRVNTYTLNLDSSMTLVDIYIYDEIDERGTERTYIEITTN